jgi:hypothetical protein
MWERATTDYIAPSSPCCKTNSLCEYMLLVWRTVSVQGRALYPGSMPRVFKQMLAPFDSTRRVRAFWKQIKDRRGHIHK